MDHRAKFGRSLKSNDMNVYMVKYQLNTSHRLPFPGHGDRNLII